MTLKNAQEILAQAALARSVEWYEEKTADGTFERYHQQYGSAIPERPVLEHFLREGEYPDWSEITEQVTGNGFTFEFDGETHFVKELDSYGGEGQGDEFWYVFEVDGKAYKLDAFYASWDGVYWDDATLFEVKPKEVMKIDWVAV